MKAIKSIVNDTTKKVTSFVGIHHIHHHGGDTGESSPLLDQSRNEADTAENPPAATQDSSSSLSLSQEFRPFERSKKALILCGVNALFFAALAVIAYSFIFEQWSIVDSLYFGTVVFTTIGYGDLSPSTDGGRLFTIFFALYGIGILGALLTIIGTAVIEAGHKAMAETEARAKKRLLAMFSTADDGGEETRGQSLCQEVLLTVLRESPIILLLFIFSILLGLPEGRSIITSIYFAVITATTIGFGDFHPSSTIMRAICIVYLPFAVAVFGQVLTQIASVYMDMKARQTDKAFLQRQLALQDLKAMDVDGDGKVSYGEFLAFILVAMKKVDANDLKDIRAHFDALDVNNNGYLEKSDLVKLASEGTSMQLADSIRRMGFNAAVSN